MVLISELIVIHRGLFNPLPASNILMCIHGNILCGAQVLNIMYTDTTRFILVCSADYVLLRRDHLYDRHHWHSFLCQVTDIAIVVFS